MLSTIAEIIRDLLIFVAVITALLIALVVVISKMPDTNPLKRILTALSYRLGATLAAGALAIPLEPVPGIDVSVKETSVCIVDDTGKIIREVKVTSEPDALLAVLTNPAYCLKRVGLEAGPLSQWLCGALAEAHSLIREWMADDHLKKFAPVATHH